MNLTVNQFVRIFAGAFVLISLALGVEGSPLFVSRWALAFTAFVGLNLFQFGFSNFCPLGIILRKLGVERRTQAIATFITAHETGARTPGRPVVGGGAHLSRATHAAR